MNRFLVANAGLCIGCKTCEIACVVAHLEEGGSIDMDDFYPRLRVVKEGDVTAPAMCHQCDDAPCVAECSTEAITLAGDVVKVEQSLCIGCQACVYACPFDAMNVVSRTIKRVVDGQTSERDCVEALKCDLCGTRAQGPACIEVCPTKAINLIGSKELQTIRQERQKATLLAMLR